MTAKWPGRRRAALALLAACFLAVTIFILRVKHSRDQRASRTAAPSLSRQVLDLATRLQQEHPRNLGAQSAGLRTLVQASLRDFTECHKRLQSQGHFGGRATNTPYGGFSTAFPEHHELARRMNEIVWACPAALLSLLDLLASEVDPEIRRIVSQYIGPGEQDAVFRADSFYTPELVTELLSQLESARDPYLRRIVVRAVEHQYVLGGLPVTRDTLPMTGEQREAVLRMVRTETDGDTKRALLRSLKAYRWDAQVRRHFLAVALSPGTGRRDRIDSILALTAPQEGEEDAYEALVSLIKSPDDRGLVAYAVRAVGFDPLPQFKNAVDAMCAALATDPDPSTRAEALAYLSRFDTPLTADYISSLVADESIDSGARESVLAGIQWQARFQPRSYSGNEGAITDALWAVARDGSLTGSVRAEAYSAAVAFASRHLETSPATATVKMTRLLAEMRSDRSSEVRERGNLLADEAKRIFKLDIPW